MTLYRQSDVPEVFVLAWVLACHTGKGLPNRPRTPRPAGCSRSTGTWRNPPPWRARYLEGGVSYRGVKAELVGLLEARFGPARVAYRALLTDPTELDRVLAAGAERARARAAGVIERVRDAVGLRAGR